MKVLVDECCIKTDRVKNIVEEKKEFDIEFPMLFKQIHFVASRMAVGWRFGPRDKVARLRMQRYK